VVIADKKSADVREATLETVPMRSTKNASMKTESQRAPDQSFDIAARDTGIAYSDCHERWRNRGSCPQRNLNFCCSVTVSRDQAVEITQLYVRGYNLFSPKLLSVLPETCRIRLAREGSVCIYCETAETLERSEIVKKLRCDEFVLWQTFGGTNVYRLWWD
jgi:hypothetical protein